MRYLVKFKYKGSSIYCEWHETVHIFVISEITDEKLRAAILGCIGGRYTQYDIVLLDVKPLDKI